MDLVKKTLKHTHSTLSVAIELVHLLLTAERFVPAVRASRSTVRASWLVYQGNSFAKKILLYSLYWALKNLFWVFVLEKGDACSSQ